MSYLTTFGGVFVVLCMVPFLTIIPFFTVASIMEDSGQYFLRKPIIKRYAFCILAVWAVILILAAIVDIHSTTTFLAVCALIGVILFFFETIRQKKIVNQFYARNLAEYLTFMPVRKF